MTAKLDAINACLAGIGLAPISNEDDPDIDAATASSVIDRISRETQEAGWYFNKEYNFYFVPDSNTGQVPVPANALSIITTGYSRDYELTIRSGKLYDMWNHTFDVRDAANVLINDVKNIEVAFILHLDFNDLPPVAQTAITYIARRQFAQDLEVDERRWKFQMRDEEKAVAMLQRENARSRKHNSIRDNATMQTFISRVGGYNSVSGRLTNFPRRNTYN